MAALGTYNLGEKISPCYQMTKHVLMDGYCKSIFKEKIIPIDVLSLILLFWDSVHHCRIEFDQKRHILNENTDWSHFNAIRYRGVIQSEEYIIPHAQELSDYSDANDYVFQTICMMFEMAPCSNNANKVSFVLQLYCHQNDTKITKLETFENMAMAHSKIYLLIDYKKTEHSHLTFDYFIDFLKIGDYYVKYIQIKSCTFIWKMDVGLLGKMKECVKYQTFYSDAFDEINENWCLEICPKDYNRKHFDEVYSVLYLNLLRLPHTIRALQVQISLNNKTIKKIKTFTESKKRQSIMKMRKKNMNFDEKNHIIKVYVKIVNVVGKNGE